jgi:hypothetical protein
LPRIQDIYRQPAPGDAVTEVAGLQAIIRAAIPHQSNGEVARWLNAGLSPGGTVHDNYGNRIA